jgi:mannonate dehydratase
MKIAKASVNITSPGRNFVTLKVETDEGIYGLGDGTLNGRELAVASYLTDHVIPCIMWAAIHFRRKISGSISIAELTGGAGR